MSHPDPNDLDIRIQEHNRRVADVNRYGWLRSNPIRTGRSTTVGTVLAAVVTRLATSTSVCEGSQTEASLDGTVTGNAALGTV
jgi:hypothetical protein